MQLLNYDDYQIPLDVQEVYALNRARPTMRIADRLLKSVGFVSRYDPTPDGGATLKFGGTAFIVGVAMEGNLGLAHLVTAKHVAEAIDPAEAVIAMNAKDGQPRFLRTGNERWFYHPTESDSVDVAVIPFGCEMFQAYDIVWLPEDIFATEKRIVDFNIGLGDEIFAIGLFTRFFGSTHLIPLVRSGNLAMMPKDKISTQSFGDMEAYLVEGRSIGGLSGSPVFVRHTVKMPVETSKGPGVICGLGAELHLLGLMHGHWDVPTTFSDLEQAEAVNMGVSIVIPAKKILETLYHPQLVARRKEWWESTKKDSPTTDSTIKPELTKEQFEAALKKASRKLSDQK